MRFLHTADWHAGKKLGRIDRSGEFEAVFDELVAVARDQKVDAVLVAGDLWDRALPPLESIELVVDTLIRLADAAGTVVAMPGNHDSAGLFQLMARLLEPKGVLLTPRMARPERGGVVKVRSRDGTECASVAVLPFVHEAFAITDLMAGAEDWFKELDPGALMASGRYSDKITSLCRALCAGFDPREVGLLMAHFFVDGAQIGGGERRIHLGTQYAATAQAIPPGAQYVALGHIHRPQEVVGAPAAARYSGSVLQLDFSERGHAKEVAIVEVKAGQPARVTPIKLTSGRRLVRVAADLENLQSMAGELAGAYLDVRVKTSGPVFGLAEQVRKILPDAVMVQAVYERSASSVEVGPRAMEAGMADLYAGFHQFQHGVAASAELLDEVRFLEEEVIRAAS
ncbi:MAG: metallophosphoesterase family protein [Actinomycetota bacterium]